MNRRNRIALGIGSSLALGAGGAGIATGAGSDTTPPAGSGGGPPGAAAIASYLGLTSDQIRADLDNGETLAQLATAQGKSVAGLEAAIVGDATTNLDAAVTAGKLTSAQEATRLANLKDHVDELVNSTGPPAGMKGGPGGRGPGGGPASQAIASYLGITASTLESDLNKGQTLAQVATAQGKTAAGLEAAVLADAKSHLDAAVTAGKLTSAQETTMLADLSSHVADLVNSTGPPAGGPGPPGAQS
jgi:hypothetical protein